MQYRATFARRLASSAVCTGLTWTVITTGVHAQEPEAQLVAPVVPTEPVAPPPPTLKIEALPEPNLHFERGLAALEAGQAREAATAFEAAYAQDHNPASLLKLGAAYTSLERPYAAVKALTAYVELAAPSETETVNAAKLEIERLREASGRIGLHMIPTDAKLTLDGEAIVAPHDELLVAPGKHSIAASAEGYKPFEQALDVLPGQFTLEIELQRVDTSPAAAALTSPTTVKVEASAALREPTDEPETSEGPGCLLSAVCVGPVASLIGPPNLIGGGIHARFGHYLGLGFDYQALPKLNFNPLAATTSLVSANARVYPFGGSFFVSGGIGYQAIKGEVNEGDISVRAQAGFPVGMASLGWMGHDGFVLGADLGLLFPLNPIRIHLHESVGALTQNGISQSDLDDARAEAETQVNKVLKAVPVLVQINLLRLGYMF